MAKTTDASRTVREEQEIPLRYVYPVTLASAVATAYVAQDVPAPTRCRAKRLYYTVITAATTADKDATFVVRKRIQNSTADTALKTAAASGQLKLTTTLCGTAGISSYVTLPIEETLLFEPGDTFSIYVSENPTGAFAEGVVQLVLEFEHIA